MQTTTLRKVGGSVMMTVPPSVLEELHLTAGTVVSIEGGNDQTMTVKPCRPKYTAEQLLAEYDATTPWTEEEREWLDAPAVGRELI